MTHRLTVACAAVLCLAPQLAAAGETELTLQSALARSRQHSPAIVAVRAGIDEARGRLTGASALLRDNPEIEGAAGARQRPDGDLLEAAVGVRQVFELGGRRSARIDAAEAGVAAASADLEEVTRRVLRDTALAFYAVLHASERMHLAGQVERQATEIERIAARRHAAGDTGILDLNVAAAALGRARSDVLHHAAARDTALGALRLQLALPPDVSLNPQGNLARQVEFGLDELLRRASERPDLRAIAAAARAAQAEIRLGRGLAWPDVGVGAAYERDDGGNVGLGTLSFTLPVFQRGQGLQAEAAARERRALGALEDARRSVLNEVHTAFLAYRKHREAVRVLEEGSLRELDAGDALAQRSFEAGQIGLAELLALRREILEIRSQAIERRLDATVAAVELESAAGVLQ